MMNIAVSSLDLLLVLAYFAMTTNKNYVILDCSYLKEIDEKLKVGYLLIKGSCQDLC